MMPLPGRRETSPGATSPGTDAIALSLQRLWQTKLNSISFLEDWIRETRDTDIRAGLTNQLVDERRHLRLIGEELRRRGAPVNGGPTKEQLSRPFMEVRVRRDDYLRLEAYYHGIKEFDIARCGQLVAAADGQLARVLDEMSQDEQRQVRWAEVRIRRLQRLEKAREANVVLGKVRNALESVWGRSFRNLRLVTR